tara:strand:- start:373 stop:684 length:312 start_codon:yes stop_codon:yes gene_type:complete
VSGVSEAKSLAALPWTIPDSRFLAFLLSEPGFVTSQMELDPNPMRITGVKLILTYYPISLAVAGFHKTVYVLRSEPAVASDTEAVTSQKASITSSSDRMLMNM